MKKVFITAAVLFSCLNSFAQTKGDVLLYGGIYGGSEKDAAGARRNYFNISPGIGYFINDHLTVGVFGGYNTRSSLDTSAGSKRVVNSEFAVGPFIRYTHTINNIFFIYDHLELGYASGRASIGGTVVPNSGYRGFFASFTPQVGINIKNGFALNFGIGGINFQNQKGDLDANASNRVFFDFGRRTQVGVSKFFHKKKKVIVTE